MGLSDNIDCLAKANRYYRLLGQGISIINRYDTDTDIDSIGWNRYRYRYYRLLGQVISINRYDTDTDTDSIISNRYRYRYYRLIEWDISISRYDTDTDTDSIGSKRLSKWSPLWQALERTFFTTTDLFGSPLNCYMTCGITHCSAFPVDETFGAIINFFLFRWTNSNIH